MFSLRNSWTKRWKKSSRSKKLVYTNDGDDKTYRH